MGHIGDIERFSNPHKLANYAGVAPHERWRTWTI
ncbi:MULTISPECIES: IS110 family transposase [Listeria]|nr:MULTISPECIES: IS110 family transposase [Listeria]